MQPVQLVQSTNTTYDSKEIGGKLVRTQAVKPKGVEYEKVNGKSNPTL